MQTFNNWLETVSTIPTSELATKMIQNGFMQFGTYQSNGKSYTIFSKDKQDWFLANEDEIIYKNLSSQQLIEVLIKFLQK